MKEFLDAFKHLEKICNEIYGGQHGVTQYIDEMKSTSVFSARKVFGWEQDLSGLMRVRRIRNAMVHDDSGLDTNYTFEDVQFMKNFYDRIMNSQDPLALLRKQNEAARAKNKAISEPVNPYKIKIEPASAGQRRDTERGLRILKLAFWMFILFLVIMFISAIGALIFS